MYVRPFGGTTTGLGSKHFGIQKFPGTPTGGDGTIDRRRAGQGGIRFSSDPSKPNICETSASLPGDEDIFLHQIECYLLLEAIVETVLL